MAAPTAVRRSLGAAGESWRPREAPIRHGRLRSLLWGEAVPCEELAGFILHRATFVLHETSYLAQRKPSRAS
jgi:hypothetical protein